MVEPHHDIIYIFISGVFISVWSIQISFSNIDSSLAPKMRIKPPLLCKPSGEDKAEHLSCLIRCVIFTHTTTMEGKASHHDGPSKEVKPVFLSKVNEVYRIPALLYDPDRQILMAFAEQRRSPDDASAKMLVMKTGVLTSEAISGVRTVEVIIPSSCLVCNLPLFFTASELLYCTFIHL